MNFFSSLYNKVINWSSHQHAPYYLAGISFIESSFFPIPPDIMLISMGLARPPRAWYYAFIATLFSVIGGVFGYLIGFYGMDLIQPYILASSYAAQFEQIQQWFDLYGVWIVIMAGFTPLPYKLFTISAGALHMALLPFVVASIIGRSMRFFLVSCVLYFAGNKIEASLRRFIDKIVCVVMAIIVIGFCLMKWVF